jgi:hypothetical protein
MKKLLYLFVLTSIFLSSCSKNCPIPEAQEEWLFVHTAESAKILNTTTIVMPLVDDIFAFTDRPYRKSYHMTGRHYADLWTHKGENCFQDAPPNAVLTWVDGGESKEIEVVITHAVLDSTTITYTIWDDSGIITEDIVHPSLFVDGANSIFKVGDWFVNGVIFYVADEMTDLTGDGLPNFGLIAAPTDCWTGLWQYRHQWTDFAMYFRGSINRTGIGTGHKNTKDIIAFAEPLGAWTAAYIAKDYGSTYDWFLPSKDELKLMNQHKDVINKTAIANGGSGFADDEIDSYYWSSTEDGNAHAWGHYFAIVDHNSHLDDKGGTSYVRAVRAF